jgi:hypothetical protein
MIQRANNLDDLIEAIQSEIEWFETTEGDDLECIGIENLEGILSKYFNTTIKLLQDGNI